MHHGIRVAHTRLCLHEARHKDRAHHMPPTGDLVRGSDDDVFADRKVAQHPAYFDRGTALIRDGSQNYE